MLPTTSAPPVATIDDMEQAAAALSPTRLRILELAREPLSASEIARRVGEPRQRINYHVRELVRAGLLQDAGEVRRGNMVEHLVQTAAQAFALSPRLLGDLAPDPARIPDRAAAVHLLALTSRTQSELSEVLVAASRRGQKVPTLSLEATVRFRTPQQRAAFADALTQALADIIARFSSPAEGPSYRVVIGSYPEPQAQAQ